METIKTLNIDSLKQYFELVRKYLSRKVEAKKKIRVGFFVLFDSVFQGKPLFKKMIDDDMFDPFILIIPNVNITSSQMITLMHKNYKSISSEFPEASIYEAYNSKNEFIDYIQECDMICFENPYDHLTHKFYTVEYARKQKVLPFLMNYGFLLDFYSVKRIINLYSYNCMWKVFAETQEIYTFFKECTARQGEQVELTGYCKMDALADIVPRKLERKRIILAPHHTVEGYNPYITLSNFLLYADFFLELPKLYPEIDFVFRPHPLLFLNLSAMNIWTQVQIDSYLKRMQENKNVEYQDGGDYFDTFVNSHGIIHDCGSFIAEYLYTNSPACYMVRKENILSETFLPLAMKCLDHYHLAHNKEDILNFIDTVIIQEQDDGKEARLAFANKEIRLNYPHASDVILDILKRELTSK